MFEKLTAKGFQVLTLHHAEAILKHDMSEAAADLEQALLEIEMPVQIRVKQPKNSLLQVGGLDVLFGNQECGINKRYLPPPRKSRNPKSRNR